MTNGERAYRECRVRVEFSCPTLPWIPVWLSVIRSWLSCSRRGGSNERNDLRRRAMVFPTVYHWLVRCDPEGESKMLSREMNVPP